MVFVLCSAEVQSESGNWYVLSIRRILPVDFFVWFFLLGTQRRLKYFRDLRPTHQQDNHTYLRIATVADAVCEWPIAIRPALPIMSQKSHIFATCIYHSCWIFFARYKQVMNHGRNDYCCTTVYSPFIT